MILFLSTAAWMCFDSVSFASLHFTTGPKNCTPYDAFVNGGTIESISPVVPAAAAKRVKMVRGLTNDRRRGFSAFCVEVA